MSSNIDVVITPNENDFKDATQKERERALCDFFTGLSTAIRKHGCTVDISNPNEIKITRKITRKIFCDFQEWESAAKQRGWLHNHDNIVVCDDENDICVGEFFSESQSGWLLHE